jgi:hypothetical protein
MLPLEDLPRVVETALAIWHRARGMGTPAPGRGAGTPAHAASQGGGGGAVKDAAEQGVPVPRARVRGQS